MVEEVVREVLWTNSAKTSFDHIVEYLQNAWTEKEVTKFINRTTEIIAALKRYPEMCRPSAKRKNVRIAILNKHTQLVYHYKPRNKQIEILLFWDTKQNPATLKY
jgi:plasmid stabilization system protein ParE